MADNIPHIDPDAMRAPEPPQNLDVEAALLGVLIANNDAYHLIAPLVAAEDFADSMHRQLFIAISKQIAQGRSADLATIGALFTERDERVYLASLIDTCFDMSSAPGYAGLIADLADRRRQIDVLDRARERLIEPSIDLVAPGLRARALADLEASAGNRAVSDDIVSAEVGIDAALDASQHAASHSGIVGLSTGFDGIDDIIHGLVPAHLYVDAARPSMGKSILAGNISMRAAKLGLPVLYFSLEMQRAQMWQRFLAEETGIDLDLIIKGNLDTAGWDRLIKARGDLAQLPLRVVDRGGLNIDHMRAMARMHRRKYGLSLVVADHMHLMESSDERSRRGRNEDLTHISRGLKRLASDLDVPVLALSQLSRSCEDRDDKRPVLRDLRESGAIEQDADVVFFMYRDEYYLERSRPQKADKQTAEQHSARLMEWQDRLDQARGWGEVIVAKNRHGRVGTVRLRFDGAHARFSSPAAGDSQDEASRFDFSGGAN